MGLYGNFLYMLEITSGAVDQYIAFLYLVQTRQAESYPIITRQADPGPDLQTGQKSAFQVERPTVGS